MKNHVERKNAVTGEQRTKEDGRFLVETRRQESNIVEIRKEEKNLNL